MWMHLRQNSPDNSYDFIVVSNVIHHLAFPSKFFLECQRILKPNGILVIQEIETSLLMRMILRVMKHEGYDEMTNVYDVSVPCNNPLDPWSANCSIPKLLFASSERFEDSFPNFSIVSNRLSECFIFLNSGGVVAKTRYIPMSNFFLKITNLIDLLLVLIAPRIFALQRQIVLKKN